MLILMVVVDSVIVMGLGIDCVVLIWFLLVCSVVSLLCLFALW